MSEEQINNEESVLVCEEIPVKRGRGRPKKALEIIAPHNYNQIQEEAIQPGGEVINEEDVVVLADVIPKEKKPRGRPKNPNPKPEKPKRQPSKYGDYRTNDYFNKYYHENLAKKVQCERCGLTTNVQQLKRHQKASKCLIICEFINSKKVLDV